MTGQGEASERTLSGILSRPSPATRESDVKKNWTGQQDLSGVSPWLITLLRGLWAVVGICLLADSRRCPLTAISSRRVLRRGTRQPCRCRPRIGIVRAVRFAIWPARRRGGRPAGVETGGFDGPPWSTATSRPSALAAAKHVTARRSRSRSPLARALTRGSGQDQMASGLHAETSGTSGSNGENSEDGTKGRNALDARTEAVGTLLHTGPGVQGMRSGGDGRRRSRAHQ